MAVMKSLALLPFSLLAVSCIPAEPYAQQRPPTRNGALKAEPSSRPR